MRQDTNQVLVFDGTTYTQIAALRTSATPTQMAFTFDRKYLIVGHDNAQLAWVYDLDTLQRQVPIQFPPGHYPRPIAGAARPCWRWCAMSPAMRPARSTASISRRAAPSNCPASASTRTT